MPANAVANGVICSIEMNVIIIAACIPTIRPIFLVLCKRPGAENFRASVRERGHSSYCYRTADDGPKKTMTGSSATYINFDQGPFQQSTSSTEAINQKHSEDGGSVIQIENKELGSRDEDEEWEYTSGPGLPMTNIKKNQKRDFDDRERPGRAVEV